MFFNLTLLEASSRDFVLSEAPFVLAVRFLLAGAFLARGVYWPLATSPLSFTGLMTERLGATAALSIKWAL